LQVLFHTQAIPLWVWPRLFLAGLVFFLVIETEKLILRRGAFRQGAPELPEASA
jgi:hypothetical protein